MRTTLSILLLMAMVAFLFVRARHFTPEAQPSFQVTDTVVVYTAEARAIIDQKCFGCHNPESKSEKAKKKLLWDELPKLAKAQQVKTMNDILEVLDEGAMPPEKFLETKPEAKLTKKETRKLADWAEENALRLMK